MTERFTGFASGARALALPESFVTRLLPLLDGPSLAAALCALRILHHRKGFPRFLTPADLAADPALAAFLARTGGGLDAALQRLLDAGMLLRLEVEQDGRCQDLLFLNAPADRRGMVLVRSRAVALREPPPEEPAGEPPPDIFALYEENVGPLTPIVAQDLAEAAERYPREWLEAAIGLAAERNVRNWRYVARILERWSVEGPDYEKAGRDPADDLERYYFGGRYGRVLKERFDAGRSGT